MKKSLIALAASMAVVAGAQAETKLYGKFNVSAQYEDAEAATDPSYKLESHASRLGVKGSEDLGNAKAIYQMEFEVYVDDGQGKSDKGSDTLEQRNIYVGLDYGSAGSIRMGHFDTPLKVSQGKFDVFNDVADIKNVLDGEQRDSNQINYTVGFGDLVASVSTIMREAAGKGNYTSASLTYKAGDLYLSLAMDDGVPESVGTQRLTAIYTLGDLRLGLMAQNVDEKDTAGCGTNNDVKDCDTLGYSANITYKLGKNVVKAQYTTSDQDEEGAAMTTVGVDHKLGKATTAYALYNMYSNDADKSGLDTAAVGLIHKF